MGKPVDNSSDLRLARLRMTASITVFWWADTWSAFTYMEKKYTLHVYFSIPFSPNIQTVFSVWSQVNGVESSALGSCGSWICSASRRHALM